MREGPAVEQFAQEHIDTIQVVGVGAQDDFNFALRFVDNTGARTPTMLWDPSFETWQSFGVSANSQMMVMSPDLESGSNLIFGFSSEQQAAILDFASTVG